MSTITPQPIPSYTATNFQTLARAGHDGNLVLMSAIRNSDQANVSLICAVAEQLNGDVIFTPFAEMIEGNPFELYTPPTGMD